MMLDSGVYDDCIDLYVHSDSEDNINLKIPDDEYDILVQDKLQSPRFNHKILKMGSEVNLFTDACLLSKAEMAMRQVRDSYNDLRIKEETMVHGRSGLGPLTGRFDKACRLTKSYYFGKSSGNITKNLNSDFKKVSLSGLDLDYSNFSKINENTYDDLDRLIGTSRRREDFVESLKKLFNSHISKYGSATGSLCSMTSSDYSSWSNDRSGREESADESNEFLLTEDEVAIQDKESKSLKNKISFVSERTSPEKIPSDNLQPLNDLISSEVVEVDDDCKIVENVRPERRIELDIEETMPKLNWDFLEEQLEKALLKEKSVSSQLRDDILRKMAIEAKNDDDDADDQNNNNDDDDVTGDQRNKMYRMSSYSCDDLNFISSSIHPSIDLQSATSTVNISTAAVTPAARATASLTAVTSAAYPRGVHALVRRPTRKSRVQGPHNNQLQVCFVNELSLEEDDRVACAVATTLATPGDSLCNVEGHHQLNPSSEYSTMCSGMYRGEELDGKSLGMASQMTRSSYDSTKSSLHPLPALQITPKSLLDHHEENFFTKQSRLQAEARIALAQVRPMSYMQFLLEKQAKKESCNILQYNLPGLKKWSDLRVMCPDKMAYFNEAHLQIIINHFLSEITSLNEELMKLLIERDDLCIVQDSILVDIEDFTRRTEEWEYRKLIKLKPGSTHPRSSSSSSSPICSSPVQSMNAASLNRR